MDSNCYELTLCPLLFLSEVGTAIARISMVQILSHSFFALFLLIYLVNSMTNLFIFSQYLLPIVLEESNIITMSTGPSGGQGPAKNATKQK